MAVLIYGTHDYGRVDGAGGEYATTRFFHVYFAPLFPTGSVWITGQGAEGPRGHASKLYGKSVAAGYLRVWGPLVAFGNLIAAGDTGSLVHIGVALLAIALTAWSWSWRSVRTARSVRRSDYNFVAYGTRCEPRRMTKDMRAELRFVLDARWDARKPDRSPNDVAQHGARDAEEAAIAYGLLRLAAVDRGRDGAAEDRDADRILDDARVPMGAHDGPYRATAEAPTGSGGATLAALVELGTLARAQREPVHTPTPEQRAAHTKRSVRRARFGLVVATLFGLAGLPMLVGAVRPVLEANLSMLKSMHAPINRNVRVTCDEDPVWMGDVLDGKGRVESRIALCPVGKHLLPVRVGGSDGLPARVVQGKLRWIDDQLLWAREGLANDPALEARALQVYLTEQSTAERIGLGVLGALFVLLVPGAWILYVRWRRRTKSA